jgi:hypothetical protein
MKDRSIKIKKITRPCKITQKKKLKDKSIAIPPSKNAKAIDNDIKVTIPDILLQLKDEKELVVAHSKGFRPFDINNSDSSSFSSKDTKPKNSKPTQKRTPSPNDSIILEDLSRNQQPDIWSKGIENITYVHDEFDFESFPIQY